MQQCSWRTFSELYICNSRQTSTWLESRLETSQSCIQTGILRCVKGADLAFCCFTAPLWLSMCSQGGQFLGRDKDASVRTEDELHDPCHRMMHEDGVGRSERHIAHVCLLVGSRRGITYFRLILPAVCYWVLMTPTCSKPLEHHGLCMPPCHRQQETRVPILLIVNIIQSSTVDLSFWKAAGSKHESQTFGFPHRRMPVVIDGGQRKPTASSRHMLQDREYLACHAQSGDLIS